MQNPSPVAITQFDQEHWPLSHITIQRAGPRDFLAVAALDRVAWRQSPGGENVPDGEHTWRIWCELSLTFIAREGDQVVGAVLAFACDDGRYCLHKVMVAAECRGRGIASRLFDAILREIDQLKVAVFLTVNPTNAPALALYEKYGFTERQFAKGFYRDDEDRFVLTRPGISP